MLKSTFKHNKRKAFTLVEVMIVMVVIAIVAVFVIPSFIGAINNAKNATANAELKSVINAITLYRLDNLDTDKLPNKPQDLDKYFIGDTIEKLKYNIVTFIYEGIILTTVFPNGDPRDKMHNERVTLIGKGTEEIAKKSVDYDYYIDYMTLD